MLTRAPCTWHYRLPTTVSRCCCCLYIVCSTLQELGLLPLVFCGSPPLLLSDVMEWLMGRHALCELSKREREWNSRLLDGQTSANSVSTTRMLQALECGWTSPCSPEGMSPSLAPCPGPLVEVQQCLQCGGHKVSGWGSVALCLCSKQCGVMW